MPIRSWYKAVAIAILATLTLACQSTPPPTQDPGEAPPDLSKRPWGLAQVFVEALKESKPERVAPLILGNPEGLENNEHYQELGKKMAGSEVLEEVLQGKRASVKVGPHPQDPHFILNFHKSYDEWKLVGVEDLKGEPAVPASTEK
jgi:hypothetical protein